MGCPAGVELALFCSFFPWFYPKTMSNSNKRCIKTGTKRKLISTYSLLHRRRLHNLTPNVCKKVGSSYLLLQKKTIEGEGEIDKENITVKTKPQNSNKFTKTIF